MNGSRGTLTRIVTLTAIVALALSAFALTGCKSKAAKEKEARESKLKIAAAFIQATSDNDVKAIKKLVYDPKNTMNLPAESTPVTNSPKIEWKWEGDSYAATVNGQKGVLSIAPDSADVVILTAAGQQVLKMQMRADGRDWKIDAEGTAKINQGSK